MVHAVAKRGQISSIGCDGIAWVVDKESVGVVALKEFVSKGVSSGVLCEGIIVEYPARLDAIDCVSDQEDPGIVSVEPDVVAFTSSLDNVGVLTVLPKLSSPLHGRAPRIFANESPQCRGSSPPRR